MSITPKTLRISPSFCTTLLSRTLLCSLCLVQLSACATGKDDVGANNSSNQKSSLMSENTSQLTNQNSSAKHQQINQMRIMHIDLDYLYDKDNKQQTRNIQVLIQRIQALQPNTLFIQAFADPDGNGSADQVYFSNRHLPVRANLFNDVVKQIREQTQVQHVYAWLPLMAWQLPSTQKLQYVEHSRGGKDGYIRLSPFVVENQKIIADIFTDFIRENDVDGVLYHDDITLSDYEDASSAAQKIYQEWGFNSEALLNDPKNLQQGLFAQAKTAYLDDLAEKITKLMRETKPNLLVARNMYAQVTLEPNSEKWFSQSMASTYTHYDYNAIMAMPYMEKAPDHRQFYLDLIVQAKKYDPDLSRTIFELQTTNWINQTQIASTEIANTVELLRQNGVRHIGYYPDDFVHQHPNIDVIKPAFSVDDSR